MLGKLLAALSVEIGGDTSPLKRDMDGAVSYAQATGTRVGSAFAVGFNNPILNAVSGIRQLIGGTEDLASALSVATGSRAAAELGAYRRQLTGIAQDAAKAGAAYKQFQDIAANSNYNTDQVFQFGINQAGRNGDVAAAGRVTQELLDAATVFGVSAQKFNDFQINIGQIQNRGSGKVDVEDLRQFLNAAPLARTAIAQTLGVSTAEANKRLNNATGDQLFKMLEAVGLANKGAAGKAAGADPYSAASNAIDNLNQSLAPTGELINRFVTPLIGGFGQLAAGFGRLNEATGGGAGLTAVVGIGALAVRAFGGAVSEGINLTRALTSAMLQLAGAEGAAAIATRGNVRQLAFDFGPEAPTGAGKAALLKGLGGLALAAIPLALDYGAHALGDKIAARGDNTSKLTGAGISGAGTGIGVGASLGMVLGSFIPGVGNILGTAIGGGIGALVGFIKGHLDERDRQGEASSSKQTSAADALKGAASDLKGAAQAMRATVFSGGPRTRNAVSVIEAEYAMNALRMAI